MAVIAAYSGVAEAAFSIIPNIRILPVLSINVKAQLLSTLCVNAKLNSPEADGIA